MSHPTGCVLVTLREAFGILSLSEKDLDPRALEGLLTAKLETAEFHDIPKLLEAYRTVNGLLESQLWYWNPETTSIHHQDGSTIELRGVNGSAGVMTAPPPASVNQVPPRNLHHTDVELVTDSVSPPIPPSPGMAAAALDDAPIIIDDEAENADVASSAKKTIVPLGVAELPEKSARTTQVLQPPALRHAEPPTAPQRPKAIPAANADDIEDAHSTMVFVPPRRNATAPWVVAAAAVGLVGALWVFQSQISRNRGVAVPTTTQTRPAPIRPVPTPAAPKVAPPVVSPPANTASAPTPKPIQKPVTVPSVPPAPVSSKPVTPPKPSTGTPATTAVTAPVQPANTAVKPAKPNAKPPTKPAPSIAANSAKPTAPAPTVAPAKPAVQAITPKPVVSSKPATRNAPIAQPRAVVKPPAPKPVVQATLRPNTVIAPNIPARPKPTVKPLPKPVTASSPSVSAQPKPTIKPNTPRPKPVSVPAPVAVIEAPKTTGLPDNLTRDEYGRRYFNQKIYEVWQRSGAQLRYASWEAIPLELQTLPSNRFRAAVYIAAPPEPIEPPR